MLDLGRVRSFVAVATELNFNRAARRLNMTQPPLSRQIKLLEQDLDVTLFERTSRSVVLTPAGLAFLSEAQTLLRLSDAAVTATRRAARGSAGSVKIAFVGASTYSFLPGFISQARASAPQIELELVQMETAEQLQAINAGDIDLGLSRPLAGNHYVESLCVARERMMLAIPRAHPLAAKRRPAPDALNGEPFIMFSPPARYLHDKLTRLIEENGLTPRIVQSMTHSQAILSLVSAGIGLALVPAGTENACFDDVVFRSLDLKEECIAELHAIWSRDNHNPLLPEIRNIVALRHGKP
ncbi:LysR family transcriptional regulator [Agrobacterium tumefaciens]|uniref:LysR family transcriptional regulator n=1 Tax=Agrobacterium tumefaciens TaxID=358 RepID=UPI001573C423|nr:LysR family transcriptional regulator [Agrobacterium tumefaciens]NSZ66536.1 LysR family transcriptional regulator [Agrobacterium tumefaciens]NTA19426.1 LysR family transcriptional regulator [Agrobacterium tumefaciens]NTA72908.1 LysR family transcriptional regulator [Agrobacterium tumefaciens]WCK74326.1 LysR family transcriptional regulator [Agrobacterium tumefaciens]WIE41457.1 LysR family transcriptional regulator [Agrobacterium tumefaciens]